MAEARERLTQLPEQLVAEGGPQAASVTRHGKPILAVLPWELYESLVETLEILGDAEQMHRIYQSENDLAQGDTVDWAVVRTR